ncbi:RagB/SusD family nutrient uptake outer membrane protein [Mucilaginibacter mali]|uniref:RagB/SusD family nutrient uptake outer membrane protein n=1 Tax=Mucilaginibacter mali TaxID=2740462 RepID=A0A7D4Q799_9SPHI|nr:RagB/SusD family nutrient uptake outer membrane protein [Mucilaginibacter mali]QKJ32807.1 RagB/SusD family nutrient uptake outer membrane protein [Mucilaginibacter mali]
MKNFRSIYLLFALATIGIISGCKKWLDVKPESKFVEEDLYSKPQGFYDALNGFYINNGSSDSYGGRLTMTTMDVLAQYYLVNASNSQYTMSTYNYTDDASKTIIDNIWSKTYINILNLNKLFQSIDTYGSVLSDAERKRIQGEAYGLRAFYYFDLMRMFTKPYTADSLTKVLPYYDKPTNEISEFKPTNFVMQKVLSDLAQAEALLSASDPAMTQTQVSKITNAYGRDGRNYHMNYYAVKALQARVNLWKGDKAAALSAAKVLIDNQAKFPWTAPADLNTVICNKTFATEMIFGVENPKLNDLYLKTFAPGLFDTDILAPSTNGNFINSTVFEGNNATDYRCLYIWKVNGRPYPTFFKYNDESNVNSSINFYRTVPLIRMSEMYLVAAECEPDLTTAAAYLNLVRTKRAIASITIANTAALNTAIMKEFRKEFAGEGQLFFYYKRTNALTIVAGGTNANLSMTDSKYTFPVPLSETMPR